MERKKISLIIIIVLLIIFVPLSIFGIIFQNGKNMLDENPAHDRYYKGYVWFYDENDNFLNKYECKTEICELSSSTIDDDKYGINYYKEGTKKEIDVINNHYAFIRDGELNYLFDITKGTAQMKFKSVKTYNTSIDGNLYILQNERDVWGAARIGNEFMPVLSFEYDFIGLTNNLDNNGNLVAKRFIVLKDSMWYLVDDNDSALITKISYPIVDYSNTTVVAKVDNSYKIYDYNNNEHFTDMSISKYILLNNCIGVVSGNYLHIYTNIASNSIKEIYLTDLEHVSMESAGNIVNVKINDSVIDTIAIN